MQPPRRLAPLAAAVAVLSTAAAAAPEGARPFWESVYNVADSHLQQAPAKALRQPAPPAPWHPSLEAIEYHSLAGVTAAAADVPASAPEGEAARLAMQRDADSMWMESHAAEEKSAAPARRVPYASAMAMRSAVTTGGGAQVKDFSSNWHNLAADVKDEGVAEALWSQRWSQELRAEVASEKQDTPPVHKQAVQEISKLRQLMRHPGRAPAFLQNGTQAVVKEETIEEEREDEVAASVAREAPTHHHALAHVTEHRERELIRLHEAEEVRRRAVRVAAHLPEHAHVPAARASMAAQVDAEAADAEADHTEVRYKSDSERTGRAVKKAPVAVEPPTAKHAEKSGTIRLGATALLLVLGALQSLA